jgi:DMSO reductase family type II enzyme chaperone
VESPRNPEDDPALDDWRNLDPYRFFAFVLGSPSLEKFSWLANPFAESALAALGSQLGIDGGAPPLEMFENYADYEASYIALFDVGMPEPPVPLLESFYRKDVPPQQTVLENTDFYAVLELKADNSVTAPDHLVTQLEFLASVRYLSENCPDAQQRGDLRRLERDFLERHLLGWIPAVREKIADLQPPAFLALFFLLARFLRGRYESIASD